MNDEAVHFFPGKLTPLSKILEDYLSKEGLAGPIKVYQMIDRFGEYFPAVARFCKCDEYRKEILYLSVSDPIFTLEVQKLVPEICRVYQEQGIVIKKVKIRGIFSE